MTAPLRVALIASNRFPLRSRSPAGWRPTSGIWHGHWPSAGHDVSLFAGCRVGRATRTVLS